MPLYRLAFIADPMKETRETIENNQIDLVDVHYRYFKAQSDNEADGRIDKELMPQLVQERNGQNLKGWSVQKGRRGSTESHFRVDAASLHGLFAMATTRKELSKPQKNYLMEIILLGRIVQCG